MMRWLVVVMFLVHGAISAMAIWESGFVAIFTDALSGWTHLQVFSDLGVALVLLSGMMVADARRNALPVWPFLAAIPLVGSFAPLAWFVWRLSPRRS